MLSHPVSRTFPLPRKPAPPEPPLPAPSAFRYSIVWQDPDGELAFVIVAASMADLARAWRLTAKTKLDPSKVDTVTLTSANR